MEVLDSVGGLIASAPALCTFMDAYWIGGDQRVAGSTGEWIAFGSLPARPQWPTNAATATTSR